MDSKSWEKAKDVITDALKRSPSEREAFVREHCPDETLRAEVDALLKHYEEAPDFLEEPPHIEEPDELDDLQPGSHVGPYVIVDRLGRGGMGQVFLGSDPRLRRKVALKCLISSRLTGDDRRRRILDEARAAARINHPNVATVHDVLEHESRAFIVMEYVEGESLAARLKRERLPIDRVVGIGRQLAGALAAAHATGIIHRDLKPANIQVTVDGAVKVLDFGVARALAMASRGSTTTTADQHAVREPQIGTPGYMSPEQILGQDVDERSDLFSLGVILYEMTTGHRPFASADSLELVVALAERPPRADAVDPRVPRELADVIGKALEIDRDERLRSAAALGSALEAIERRAESLTAAAGGPTVAVGAAAGGSWGARRLLLVAAAVIATLVAGMLGLDPGLLSRLRGGRSDGAVQSIAVLPFVNLSGDPSQEHVADGITEVLITDLSKLGSLRVISRTSVWQFKDLRVSLPEIARRLHVETIVEGTVARAGDRVRVTVQLIRAATDQHLWAEQYDRAMTDILTLQGEVAQTIATNVAVKVSPQERRQITNRPPANTEAQDAYLQGRFALNAHASEMTEQAVRQFEHAVQLDPTYALAYAGLAEAYIQLANVSTRVPRAENSARAKTAAHRALDLDDTLSGAYVALALAEFYFDWDWNAAAASFARALALNPNDALAHANYGFYLAALGRLDEALSEVKRARELEPLIPIRTTSVSAVLYYARRYDEAAAEARAALTSAPSFVVGHRALARVYAAKKEYEPAIRELEQAMKTERGAAELEELSLVLAEAGRIPEAQQALAELTTISQRQARVSADSLAYVYAALGDLDRAFALMNEAFDHHAPGVLWLRVDPRADRLRSDPRFAPLLAGLGNPR